MVSSSGMPVSLKTDLRFPITGQQGHGSRNIQLNVPTDEVVPQAPSMVHSFMPQLTIEKNGFVISLNSHTPKELLILALEAASHV